MQARFAKVLSGMAAAGLLAAAGPAAAFTWNTASDANTACTANGVFGAGYSQCIGDGGSPASGNLYTFSDGAGHNLTAAAFNAATNTGTLTRDFLGMYNGNGLGVGYGGSPNHAVDNGNGTLSPTNKVEMIAFKFPAGSINWDAIEVDLNLFGSGYDSDATILVGKPVAQSGGLSSAQVTQITSGNGLDGFAGISLSLIAGGNGNTLSGFKQIDSLGALNGGNRPITGLGDGSTDTYVFVSTILTKPMDGNLDAFKVSAIVGNGSTGVPEPSTLSLIVAGSMAGLYVRRRRAQRAA